MCADREETTAKINSGGLAQPVNIIRTCVMFCCAEWMKYICTETVLVSEQPAFRPLSRYGGLHGSILKYLHSVRSENSHNCIYLLPWQGLILKGFLKFMLTFHKKWGMTEKSLTCGNPTCVRILFYSLQNFIKTNKFYYCKICLFRVGCMWQMQFILRA